MTAELGWSRAERVRQIDAAVAFYKSMGLHTEDARHARLEPLPRGAAEKAWHG
ncbi:hypothetical protein C0993_000828, partial [Termitomyces sp. T159_Od127]